MNPSSHSPPEPPRPGPRSLGPTPAVVVDLDRLNRNLERMQALCSQHGVQLWPHIKTHKMVEVARRQLRAGATGLTCAKISEAEAMLPSGVRKVFIAHSLVGPEKAPRLRHLSENLDTLVVACTSETHWEVLEELLTAAGLRLPVMMAVDSGLGREGTRGVDSARHLAAKIQASPRMDLWGIYTHEGHGYLQTPASLDSFAADLHARLVELRDGIDPDLRFWPGSSTTASRMATLPGVQGIRPGAYVFGDLSLALTTRVMEWDEVALHVHAEVVDIPAPDLALIDAGSKVFSSDKTPGGIVALPADGADLQVLRCNEEHGYLTGKGVGNLRIGQRIAFVPAHVCTVVNLADHVLVTQGGQVVGQWKVDARGCVT
jgi:D-serine deaminase-like pyridoxal phosphate-dependent protein